MGFTDFRLGFYGQWGLHLGLGLVIKFRLCLKVMVWSGIQDLECGGLDEDEF